MGWRVWKERRKLYIYITTSRSTHNMYFVTFEKERNRHTSTDIHTKTQQTHNHI